MMSAPLIAALQVIVYAGAILVLFRCVVMLLNVPQEVRQKAGRPVHHTLSALAIVVFAAALLGALRAHGAANAPPPAGGPISGEVAPVARLLFSEHLLSFEALSVLLLAALVGAFALARREGRT
jgi:NADH-quinone oxidoreductase subunit J